MHHLGDWESRKTPQWIVHHGYRKADRVIVHGRTLREIAADAIGVSRDVIDVVPMIAVGDRPEMTAMSEEENLILFFGRIWAYKGLEYLIRALPRISESVPDARILIAGTGDDFSPYRALMHDPSRFIIHNRWIPDEERAELFQSAAVVVLPYIDATQSGVIPIAYAFSKPVVATTTGGLPDLVDHGTTGLLVPPREVEALADAIVQILTDDALRRRMGEAGNRKLKAECAPNIVAAATADVYRRAIEAHESSVGGG
jgi:glycosyltransferase involved in cell wall biosynthesis